jgi:hypothetical protein
MRCLGGGGGITGAVPLRNNRGPYYIHRQPMYATAIWHSYGFEWAPDPPKTYLGPHSVDRTNDENLHSRGVACQSPEIRHDIL